MLRLCTALGLALWLTGTATIPFDSIAEIEVYQHLPWQTAGIVAATALGSLILYAVLHEPRVHDPFAGRQQGRIGSH